MKKIVNGELVVMSAPEAAAMQAEWDANAAKQAADDAKPKPQTTAQRLAALEAKTAIKGGA